MESVKFIIQELSKEPFKKKFNMVSFSSLDSRQLLQLLNDALAEIDDRVCWYFWVYISIKFLNLTVNIFALEPRLGN